MVFAIVPDLAHLGVAISVISRNGYVMTVYGAALNWQPL
jgi:hypothetical protein